MLPVDLEFLLLALLLGALMSRTSLCTVAGIQGIVFGRRWGSVRGILAASSAAGFVLLVRFLIDPSSVRLPDDHPIGFSLLLGGVLLGTGALVNGACYLGSVLYLGRGNANFLLTLLGLALTARWSEALAASTGAAHRFASQLWPALGLVVFALFLALALRPTWRAEEPVASRSQRLPLLAAAGTGVCAALINAKHPGWSYGVVIDAYAQHRQGMVMGLSSAALLFIGAAVSSLLQHRFRFIFFQPVAAIRCLLGGMVMGYGAHQIPGGNDTLLLWTIPGLTLYGLIAYGVMAVTIAAAFMVGLQSRSQPAPTRSMPEH
jgi:hypothetical protein